MLKELGAKAFSYGYACPVLMAATYNDDGTVNVRICMRSPEPMPCKAWGEGKVFLK